jgi:hypothetical protein
MDRIETIAAQVLCACLTGVVFFAFAAYFA